MGGDHKFNFAGHPKLGGYKAKKVWILKFFTNKIIRPKMGESI